MDNGFIINSKTKKMYKYYQNQIENLLGEEYAKVLIDSAIKNCGTEEDAYQPKNTHVWCRYAVMALLIKNSFDDISVGCALKFIKDVEMAGGEITDYKINFSEYTYIHELLDKLSSSFKSISNNNMQINIDKLNQYLQSTINTYYSNPQHKRTFTPDENLKNELQKTLNGALNTENSLNTNSHRQGKKIDSIFGW